MNNLLATQASNQAPETPYHDVRGHLLPGLIDDGGDAEYSLRDYWYILLKRRWAFLSCLVIVFTLVTIATFRMTPLYQASSRIAIYKENVEALGLGDVQTVSSEDWDYSVALDTEVKILQSNGLALQVIKDLGLDKNPHFAGEVPPKSNPEGSAVPAVPAYDPELENVLLDKFRASLSVLTVPKTRIVEIRFQSPDPRLAATIANATANTFIERNFATRFESTMQTTAWLSKQLADLQIKVETSQEKLVRYQKEHGIVGLDEKQNIVTAKLDELNRELMKAEADRIQKEAFHRMAKSGNPELVARADSSVLLDKLRTSEADLRSELAQATTMFGRSYPKVQEISNQLKQVEAAIQAEIGRIGAKIRTEYESAQQREKMLRAAFDLQKVEANQLNENAIEFSNLKREADTNREVYQSLLQKLKEAQVAAGLRSNNIRIVDTARIPLAPSKPNVPRNLAMGLLLGLVGGLALAFTLESLDNTVRTPEQVEMIAALPPLGIIPFNLALADRSKNSVRKLSSGLRPAQHESQFELVTLTRPKSELSESYRALRTSILLSNSGAPPKVILFTSGLPQEGKTTSSINFAIVLAQKGGRVLLVDADMRRPSIHRVLRLTQSRGLSELLSGTAELDQAMEPYSELPNLWVVPAGPPPPFPAELLGSMRMQECLTEWKNRFDHVIIDSPPILTVTDAALLSTFADGVVMVVRAGQTPKQALRRTRNLLVQVRARVVGVLVNAVNLNTHDSYYYGGYYYSDASSRKNYYDEGPKQD